MNSVFSNHDEESDEERVVYLDASDGVTGGSNSAGGGINRNSVSKRKPLFQYRKYKGDVCDDNNIMPMLSYIISTSVLYDTIHDSDVRFVDHLILYINFILLYYSLIRRVIKHLK